MYGKGKQNVTTYRTNPMLKIDPEWSDAAYSFLGSQDMLDFHRSLPGYAPTPLVKCDTLARELGLAKLWVKDESQRFGIKAFKALGASYAIFRTLQKKWQETFGSTLTPEQFKNPATMEKLGAFTFCAATDGNHGRAVAWTAKRLQQQAVIYMPDNTATSRVTNIEGEGARVVLVPGTFDDCVTQCARDAAEHGWQVISDTAYEGYMEIPGFILLGYTSIFRELEDSLHLAEKPELDCVVLPAGVGGLAAAGAAYYQLKYHSKRPRLVCVEPDDCDCFLESVIHGTGEAVPTKGKQESIMAGLNCGIPSPLAWPIIRDTYDLFLSVSDAYAEQAMRAYAREDVVSGESGASGLAALLALFQESSLASARDALELGDTSRVLLVNTEGDTDPENYAKVVLGQ